MTLATPFRSALAALGAVALIFAGAGPAPAQDTPGQDDDIAYARAVSGVEALTSGQTLACEARSADGGRSWPCRFRVTRYVAATGRITGELTWTSLNSVHEVSGTLSGGRLTFTETRAIRAGGAHLNVTYDMRVAAAEVTGSWRDPADGATGSMRLNLSGVRVAGPVTPPPPPAAGLATGVTYVCEARSSNGARSWPCTIRFTRIDAAGGRVTGELTWSSLNSVHLVEGRLAAGRLTFKETRALRAGGAHLNVTYDMRVAAGQITGTWRDPADGATGPMTIRLRR